MVRTEYGQVSGVSQAGVQVFRSIPYAAAPEGPLRFRAPAPPSGWDGVRDCTTFGPAAPQLAPAPGAPRPAIGLDCLTLNVWSPDLGAGLPVMVWIHGGLWKHGAPSMPQYDAAVLAASGVVVVTVGYRLGFEGFGHLPGAPDNRGLLDQLAALEWVQRNIASFGGDPELVTAFGQSAGAASVALLASHGLFRRAIAQSIPAGGRTVEEALAITHTIAAAAGVAPTWEGFAGLSPEALLAVQDAPVTGGLTAFGPVVDGEPPRVGADVDLMCGSTREEFLGQGPPLPADVDLDVVARTVGGSASAYRTAHPGRPERDLAVMLLSDELIRTPTTGVAEAHAAAGGRTWLYDFAWRSPMMGAAHGVDVPFVFGNPLTRFAARFLGSPPPPEFTELSQRIRRAWTDFAATGDPGWPRFDPEHRAPHVWDA